MSIFFDWAHMDPIWDVALWDGQPEEDPTEMANWPSIPPVDGDSNQVTRDPDVPVNFDTLKMLDDYASFIYWPMFFDAFGRDVMPTAGWPQLVQVYLNAYRGNGLIYQREDKLGSNAAWDGVWSNGYQPTAAFDSTYPLPGTNGDNSEYPGFDTEDETLSNCFPTAEQVKIMKQGCRRLQKIQWDGEDLVAADLAPEDYTPSGYLTLQDVDKMRQSLTFGNIGLLVITGESNGYFVSQQDGIVGPNWFYSTTEVNMRLSLAELMRVYVPIRDALALVGVTMISKIIVLENWTGAKSSTNCPNLGTDTPPANNVLFDNPYAGTGAEAVVRDPDDYINEGITFEVLTPASSAKTGSRYSHDIDSGLTPRALSEYITGDIYPTAPDWGVSLAQFKTSIDAFYAANPTLDTIRVVFDLPMALDPEDWPVTNFHEGAPSEYGGNSQTLKDVEEYYTANEDRFKVLCGQAGHFNGFVNPYGSPQSNVNTRTPTVMATNNMSAFSYSAIGAMAANKHKLHAHPDIDYFTLEAQVFSFRNRRGWRDADGDPISPATDTNLGSNIYHVGITELPGNPDTETSSLCALSTPTYAASEVIG